MMDWNYLSTNDQGFADSHIVGLRVEHIQIRLQYPGLTKPEVLLACCLAIHAASRDNSALSETWRSILPDGTIFLSLQNFNQPWKSVAVFIRCEVALDGQSLMLSASVHIPVGQCGDPTPYHQEVSRDYMRPTQRLFPTLSLVQKRVARKSERTEQLKQDTNSWESESEESTARDQQYRDSKSYRHAKGDRKVFAEAGAVTHKYRWEDTESREGENFTERSDTQTSSHRSLARRASGGSTRNEEGTSGDEVSELQCELGFVAVGPDFTDPPALLRAWMAHSAASPGAVLVETIVHSMPDLAETVSSTVAKLRGVANVRSAPRWSGHTLDATFWNLVAPLLVVESMGCPVDRAYVDYSAAPTPIGPEQIAHQLGRAGAGKLDSRQLLGLLDPGIASELEQDGHDDDW